MKFKKRKNMAEIKKQTLLVIGISHKTAPVEIREKFSFNRKNISTAIHDIKAVSGVSECVVLSTCNRTEIYACIGDSADKIRKNIDRYILAASGQDKSFLKYFYCFSETEVIDHLFTVICGLDSMIFGEPQIVGQIKFAYTSACDIKCTGPVINRLFHSAFQVGKLVRSNTSIGKGVISFSSASVVLAKKIFPSLNGRTVLLVGTGKIGKLCAKHLIDSGSIRQLYISNRTIEKAVALADELSGEVIPFGNIEKMFGEVDIIITSISLSKPLIMKNQLKEYCARRNGRPLSLIDLGVPRNIDPEVTEIDNVHLFNIDDLEKVTITNRNKRKTEAVKAKEIIKQKVYDFSEWLKEREVIPLLNDFRNKFENYRQTELEKIKNRVSPETYETVDLVTRRIVRKFLHSPTITLKDSEPDETRNRLLESINELFINDTVT